MIESLEYTYSKRNNLDEKRFVNAVTLRKDMGPFVYID